MKPLALSSLAAVSAVGLGAWATGPALLRTPEVPYGLVTTAAALLVGTLVPWVANNTAVRPALRRYLHDASAAVRAVAVVTALLLVATVTTMLVTPWTLGWADAWLATPEQAIGLTQPEVYRWAADAGALPALALVYGSLVLQVRLACLWWCFVATDARPLWRAAAVFGVAIGIGLPLYLLLPAIGPDVYYATGLRQPHVAPMLAMRAGLPYEVTALVGMVSVPSFHQVFAGILLGLWWRTPLRWASVLVNGIAMPLATWTIGAHYAADIAVGAVLVVGAAWVVDSIAKEEG